MCEKKYLVNLDKLIEYLSGPEQEPEKKPEQKRVKIRRLVV